MSDSQYLIAVALIEQNGARSMPLGGKSFNKEIHDRKPGIEAEKISLELLLRVFQRSEEKSLSRAAKDKSVLLILISMESMNKYIPQLKADWINNGDTNEFIRQLIRLNSTIWSVEFMRYEGVIFKMVKNV